MSASATLTKHPWERLEVICKYVQKTDLQMLLRGSP